MKFLPVYFFVFFFIPPLSAQRKTTQIGLRIGEPMGISVKYFLKENSALEFIAGTAAKEWSGRYYRNSFKKYLDLAGFRYEGHQIENVFYFQGRYLFQNKINWQDIPGRFDWYWGFGLLSKRATVEYLYRYEGPPPNYNLVSVIDYDISQESVIGIEYTLDQVPVSFYLEISMCIELFDRPGIIRGFSGLGLRYNF